MIQVKYNDRLIDLPTSWRDVPFCRYIDFLDVEANLMTQVAFFMGVEHNELVKLSAGSMSQILSILEFINEPPDAWLPLEKQVDIGKATYGQIETAKAYLHLCGDKPFKALPKIIEIYTGQDANEMETTTAYPLGAFFLTNYHFSSSDTSD